MSTAELRLECPAKELTQQLDEWVKWILTGE